MTKKQQSMNIGLAVEYAEELKMLVSSLCEDVQDSESMTEAWEKVDRFYRDAEAMRNRQKCTGSKSFSITQEEVDGHTKYLQGLNLPIMINTVWESENLCIPSKVCEMHIGSVNERLALLITPEHISLPDQPNLFKKKIYVYENSEGDKGIIIAYTESEAKRLFQEKYPQRKIISTDEDYFDGGAYLYEFSKLDKESKLYCAFPW